MFKVQLAGGKNDGRRLTVPGGWKLVVPVMRTSDVEFGYDVEDETYERPANPELVDGFELWPLIPQDTKEDGT